MFSMEDAFLKSAAAVCGELCVKSAEGLSPEGVISAKKKYGANELTRKKKKSFLSKIFDGLTEPMMLILLFAFGITLAVNIAKVVRGEVSDWPESIGILIAIFISMSISLWIERRGERAFEALNRISGNITARVLRNGIWTQIPSSSLVAGDIIKLSVGDKVPADCRLIRADGFETDESPLTGESLPVAKNAEYIFSARTPSPPLAERMNMAYGGCFVSAGSATAVVTAVGEKTELGTIAGAVEETVPAPTPLQQKLSALGKTVAIFGVGAALAVFVTQIVQMAVLGLLNFSAGQDAFITSVILIVAAVPEGLPTIVAVSLALNVLKMAKQNALVKKPSACETVGGVSVICSDKTGTLTENKMTVESFYIADGGTGLTGYLSKNICINSTADIAPQKSGGKFSYIGNPTECAFLSYYEKGNPAVSYASERASAESVKVFPFSSEHKRMTSVIKDRGGITVLCKGAPEILLSLCKIDPSKKAEILRAIVAHQQRARRVVAFAHRHLSGLGGKEGIRREEAETDLEFDGYAVLADPIRPEVYGAVKTAQKAGIGIKILTGDHIATAAAVANELGLCKGYEGVFEAAEIDKMTDEELTRRLPEIVVVARSSPMAKLRVVNALKAVGEIVAVTGDGINDAPAIKAADVGIAMGISGTEVCKEASDIVLADDSFHSIVSAVRFGRGIFDNFRRFILFQLTVNLAAVLVTVVCILSGLGSPFNALQLLWINIIMDGPPALSLGLEPIGSRIMDRRPISRGEHIVTASMTARIVVNGLFIAAILLLQAFTNFMSVPVQKEKTVLFSLFIAFQLINAFNARELGRGSMLRTLGRNKLLLVVMAVTVILQIVIVQFAGGAFGTVPLTALEWFKVFGLALSVAVFSEVYKLGYSVWKNRKQKANNTKRKMQNAKCSPPS